MSSQKEQEPGTLTTQFKVIVPDLRDMVFRSCEGLSSELEVRYVEDGGSLMAPHSVRGTKQSHSITFGHGVMNPKKTKSDRKTIFDWFIEVCDSNKPLKKKTLYVSLLNSQQEKMTEWKIINAWPCRWNGPLLSTESSEMTVEYVGFAYEGIEMQD